MIRPSSTVHGVGDVAFISISINGCRQIGSAIHVDDGSARWFTVHGDDATVLLRARAGEREPRRSVTTPLQNRAYRSKRSLQKLRLPREGGTGAGGSAGGFWALWPMRLRWTIPPRARRFRRSWIGILHNWICSRTWRRITFQKRYDIDIYITYTTFGVRTAKVSSSYSLQYLINPVTPDPRRINASKD